MAKCKNVHCTNDRASDRLECNSCRGKRRRGTHRETKWRSDGPLKILFIDIETRPSIAYTWGLWNVNIGIDQIIEPGRMICWAAKWYGSDETMFSSEWDDGAEAMVQKAWKLLDEADIIVHFYGSRFDIPHLNAEFLKHGLTPPSPFKQVDLKTAVSKTFRFPSNKLQFVSQVLGLEGKEEHEGFKLWSKVIDGDKDAQKRMETYNIRDTVLLEEVYEILLPWLPNHPHRHLYEGQGDCPRCGHDEVFTSGYSYTRLSKFVQYKCEACGSFFRSGKRLEGAKIQDSVLTA